MKEKIAKNGRKENKRSKFQGNPIPVRLEQEQEGQVRELARRAKIPVANVIRGGLAYVLPRMLSGEINPFEKQAA